MLIERHEIQLRLTATLAWSSTRFFLFMKRSGWKKADVCNFLETTSQASPISLPRHRKQSPLLKNPLPQFTCVYVLFHVNVIISHQETLPTMFRNHRTRTRVNFLCDLYVRCSVALLLCVLDGGSSISPTSERVSEKRLVRHSVVERIDWQVAMARARIGYRWHVVICCHNSSVQAAVH